ncbi:hypothetical protein MPH_00789 [Macrophomina phaseolina MS6]|uniref:Uncharacterized protein n=1 Tax=Macrophomina phaseolina (strain MS6) TaxID=1126212 RepID=K2SHC6_MACPH|nr:hypothetical protein MPH_00789 [Macrophomina phaseolina MS6]
MAAAGGWAEGSLHQARQGASDAGSGEGESAGAIWRPAATPAAGAADLVRRKEMMGPASEMIELGFLWIGTSFWKSWTGPQKSMRSVSWHAFQEKCIGLAAIHLHLVQEPVS